MSCRKGTVGITSPRFQELFHRNPEMGRRCTIHSYIALPYNKKSGTRDLRSIWCRHPNLRVQMNSSKIDIHEWCSITRGVLHRIVSERRSKHPGSSQWWSKQQLGPSFPFRIAWSTKAEQPGSLQSNMVEQLR
jgi:hypothetical protein